MIQHVCSYILYIIYIYICLHQIERFILSKLSAKDLLQHRSDDSPPLLSPEEQVFARDFAGIMDKHLKSLVLGHMPSNMRTISDKAGEFQSRQIPGLID